MAPATSRRSRSPVRPLTLRASRSDRPWAIITGASSGIGHALATEAAKRGCNVVLVARRTSALADLAAALELHGAQTQVVPLCLAQPESAVALHAATAPIADRVELLVANAGRSWAGPLAAQPAEVLEQMLQLNMATVARLCRLYAADFARRGRGALLLTSSLVALAPLPHATIYGASRAFVRSLALGLRDECAPAGVVVSCLLPGATATEFAKVGGTESAMVFNLPLGIGLRLGVVLPAEQVASAAFDGLAAGTPSIVPGFLNRVYAASTRVLTARAAAAFSSAVFGDDSPLASASHLVRALPALLLGTAAVVAALPLQAAREALCWLLAGLQWLLAPVGRLLPLPLPGLAPAGSRLWAPRPRADERGRVARGCCWAFLLAFAWAMLRPPTLASDLPTPRTQAQVRAHAPTPLRQRWHPSGEAATSHVRVAVIGAGVGGAFASDTLRALGPNLRIDVYEGSARVGGRAMDSSALGEAPSSAVELGASMFIGDNRLIAEAATSLGLNTSCRHDDAQALGGTRLAIVGARRTLAFVEGRAPLATLGALASRYGPIAGLLAGARLRGLASDFIRNFSALYDELHAPATPHRSVSSLLRAAHMEEWPRRACAEALAAAGGGALAELVSGLMRNNYGQPHGSAGALCCFTAVAPLAAGGSKAAFGIRGGNARLAERMLERAGVTLHASTRVLGLTRGGRTAEEAATGAAAPYRLHTDRQPAAPPTGYDYVVLAAPCPTGLQPRLRAAAAQEGGSEAENLLARCEPMDYQHVHVTLAYGLLDAAYLFGGGQGGVGSGRLTVAELNREISDVLVADDAEVPFNSIGKVGEAQPADTDGRHSGGKGAPACEGAPLPRWKFFSAERLTDAQLDRALLCRADHVVRHAWDAPGAYPVSRPLPQAQGERGFVLDESDRGAVLHPSAIEAATSAMEVVALAGANAARLVVAHINGRA